MAFTPRKWRCSDVSCAMRPRFNVEGSKSGIFCKQHAEDAMVNVVSKRCAHEVCLTWPMVNVKGTETVVFCRRHARDGMVNICADCCVQGSCAKGARLNFVDSMVAFCRRHAEGTCFRLTSERDSCATRAAVKIQGGKTPMFCDKHAEEGMANVRMNRCSPGACMTGSSFNVKGSKTPAFCKTMLTTAWWASFAITVVHMAHAWRPRPLTSLEARDLRSANIMRRTVWFKFARIVVRTVPAWRRLALTLEAAKDRHSAKLMLRTAW